ncbi:MAG: hypothetical protein JWQ89_1597 [Devosia sp.]|nr:hypothetical protein [Devosia sp.]
MVKQVAVAEDAFGAVDAGVVGEKAGHLVGGAGFVGEGGAEDHEASALAVDERPGCGAGVEAAHEILGGGEAGGMEFGVAAGEENGVGGGIRGFVGEGGEEGEDGAGVAPVGQPVGVEEGEGVVTGDGDVLAEGRGELRAARRLRSM